MPIPVEIPKIPYEGPKKVFPLKRPDGGIEYHGFTYYPRFPERNDPQITPSKVHMVELIGKLKGRPYWEKDVIKKLHLDEKGEHVTFVPNTPQTNARLWKVKHLIRITPVTFPQGLPEDGDTRGAKVKDNGEVVFIPKLKEDAKVAEIQAASGSSPTEMDSTTLKKFLRDKWLKPWN